MVGQPIEFGRFFGPQACEPLFRDMLVVTCTQCSLSQDQVNFVDVDICERCFSICEAFPLLTDAKVWKMRQQAGGQETLDEAGAHHDKLPKQPFKVMGSVKRQTRSGVRLESMFWFLTENDFSAKFPGLQLKAMGLKISNLLDEDANRVIKGLLIRPRPNDPPYAYRRVIIWSEKLRLVSDSVLATGRQLREDQPHEVFTKECAADVKVRDEDCSAHLRW
jgi:hypothetical protein